MTDYARIMRTFALGAPARPPRHEQLGVCLLPEQNADVIVSAAGPTLTATARPCGRCDGGWIETPEGMEQCSCLRTTFRAAQRIIDSRVPRSLRAAVSGADVHRGTREAKERLEAHGALVALLGPHGAGKSHQAAIAVLRACLSGLSARWATVADLMAEVLEGYEVNRSKKVTLLPYTSTAVLVLDEVTESDNGHRREVVSHLLRQRYDAGRTTILTSNLKPPALFRQFTSDVAYRLQMKGDVRVLTARDAA